MFFTLPGTALVGVLFGMGTALTSAASMLTVVFFFARTPVCYWWPRKTPERFCGTTNLNSRSRSRHKIENKVSAQSQVGDRDKNAVIS